MYVPLNKILLVEDEEDIRTIAQIALEDIGKFTVSYCGSGKEAIQQALMFDPDLILMDMMMPGMDGATTLKELRKYPSLTKTPIVFMTARAQKREITEYLELGAIDVIPKPFDPMTLATTLRQIWEKTHGP